MNQARLAWSAFRNMIRAAGRDPVWAVTALIFSPVRAARHLIGSLIVVIVVGLVLSVVAPEH